MLYRISPRSLSHISTINPSPHIPQLVKSALELCILPFFFLITRVMDYWLYPILLISLKCIFFSCLQFDKELSQKVNQHCLERLNMKLWHKKFVSFCSNCCSPFPLLDVCSHTKATPLSVPAQQFVELQCKLDLFTVSDFFKFGVLVLFDLRFFYALVTVFGLLIIYKIAVEIALLPQPKGHSGWEQEAGIWNSNLTFLLKLNYTVHSWLWLWQPLLQANKQKTFLRNPNTA